MANKRWKGAVAPVAQVTAYLFAGTWEATDLINLTIGSKTFQVTAGSTVIATVVDAIVTAWNALSSTNYPEFAEITASRSSNSLILTADTAGRPFTCTLLTTETGGGAADAQTIDGAASSTGTATTANSGPWNWDVAANWEPSGVPVNGDAVYLENSAISILYGLAQSAVTLASLTISANYTGAIGLAETNVDGSTPYLEYRAQYLAINATLETIGLGPGQGSGRIKRDAGSVQTALSVYLTGTPLEPDVEPLQWKGTHASNVVSVYRGSVAIAGYGADTSVVATLRVGYDQSQASDAVVRCGTGTTLTTINQAGGSLTINSAATTITKTGGTLLVQGSGALTTLTDDAGTTFWRSTGTLTTANVGSGATFTMAGDPRAKTITNLNLYEASAFIDPEKTLATGTTVAFVRCSTRDVTTDFGPGRTFTLAV